MTKNNLKVISRKLRQTGASYSEILKEVPVSKSTLSLWLKDIKLSEEQQLKIMSKQIQGVNFGGLKKKEERIRKTKEIVSKAKIDIGLLNKKHLFIIGVALYWGEGAKQKETNVSQRVCFSSSNGQMVKIFLLWLDKICQVTRDKLIFDLYIHENANINQAVLFWVETLNISKFALRVRLKKHLIKTIRKNIGNNYHGQLRITVRESTDLNRKISGWIDGVCQQCGIV